MTVHVLLHLLNKLGKRDEMRGLHNVSQKSLNQTTSGSVILLPAHPASFTHNFVSGLQSFYFSEW